MEYNGESYWRGSGNSGQDIMSIPDIKITDTNLDNMEEQSHSASGADPKYHRRKSSTGSITNMRYQAQADDEREEHLNTRRESSRRMSSTGSISEFQDTETSMQDRQPRRSSTSSSNGRTARSRSGSTAEFQYSSAEDERQLLVDTSTVFSLPDLHDYMTSPKPSEGKLIPVSVNEPPAGKETPGSVRETITSTERDKSLSVSGSSPDKRRRRSINDISFNIQPRKSIAEFTPKMQEQIAKFEPLLNDHRSGDMSSDMDYQELTEGDGPEMSRRRSTMDNDVSEMGRRRSTRNDDVPEMGRRRSTRNDDGPEMEMGRRRSTREDDITDLGRRRSTREDAPYMDLQGLNTEDIPNMERRPSIKKKIQEMEHRKSMSEDMAALEHHLSTNENNGNMEYREALDADDEMIPEQMAVPKIQVHSFSDLVDENSEDAADLDERSLKLAEPYLKYRKSISELEPYLQFQDEVSKLTPEIQAQWSTTEAETRGSLDIQGHSSGSNCPSDDENDEPNNENRPDVADGLQAHMTSILSMSDTEPKESDNIQSSWSLTGSRDSINGKKSQQTRDSESEAADPASSGSEGESDLDVNWKLGEPVPNLEYRRSISDIVRGGGSSGESEPELMNYRETGEGEEEPQHPDSRRSSGEHEPTPGDEPRKSIGIEMLDSLVHQQSSEPIPAHKSPIPPDSQEDDAQWSMNETPVISAADMGVRSPRDLEAPSPRESATFLETGETELAVSEEPRRKSISMTVMDFLTSRFSGVQEAQDSPAPQAEVQDSCSEVCGLTEGSASDQEVHSPRGSTADLEAPSPRESATFLETGETELAVSEEPRRKSISMAVMDFLTSRFSGVQEAQDSPAPQAEVQDSCSEVCGLTEGSASDQEVHSPRGSTAGLDTRSPRGSTAGSEDQSPGDTTALSESHWPPRGSNDMEDRRSSRDSVDEDHKSRKSSVGALEGRISPRGSVGDVKSHRSPRGSTAGLDDTKTYRKTIPVMNYPGEEDTDWAAESQTKNHKSVGDAVPGFQGLRSFLETAQNGKSNNELFPVVTNEPRKSIGMEMFNYLVRRFSNVEPGQDFEPERPLERDAQKSPRASFDAKDNRSSCRGSTSDLDANRSPRGSRSDLDNNRSPRGSRTDLDANRSPRGSRTDLDANRSPRGSRSDLNDRHSSEKIVDNISSNEEELLDSVDDSGSDLETSWTVNKEDSDSKSLSRYPENRSEIQKYSPVNEMASIYSSRRGSMKKREITEYYQMDIETGDLYYYEAPDLFTSLFHHIMTILCLPDLDMVEYELPLPSEDDLGNPGMMEDPSELQILGEKLMQCVKRLDGSEGWTTMDNIQKDKIKKKLESITAVTFCGCGFLGGYLVGAATYIQEHAPGLLRGRLGGSSVGSLIATCIVCDVPLQAVRETILKTAKASRAYLFGPLSPFFPLEEPLLKNLLKMLPEDAHIRASGRLFLSLTRASTLTNEVVSEYKTRDELVRAVLCCCFLPGISGFSAPTFQGRRYVDGGMSNNMPLKGPTTLSINVFAGEFDISPDEDDTNYGPTTVFNQTLEMSMENLRKFYLAIVPPESEELDVYYDRGYADARKYITGH
ncbi:Patatin-like phospholipase domain-containing protein 2-like 1 [Homarus americanus]|uniref:Patatin-like phospholipase domain-containing protein 2-like 1 n=1 Tax=Homarus americanus TaxID=6706 RepID=A0A8J5N3N9_HOMAM|nr:Patatin-like phospholipase domain-containing protein 2-like 1 [Homarus americanus]